MQLRGVRWMLTYRVKVTEVLHDGLRFPESPRWREGKLWLSDLVAHRVLTVDAEGNAETRATLHDRPCGLGFLPDATPLVVSMDDRRLMRIDANGVGVAADLSEFAADYLSDMVVDAQGRAYVGTRVRRRPAERGHEAQRPE